MNSTPSSFSTGDSSIVCSAVQPQLASTRNSRIGVAAQLADDAQVVGRAELDLVDRPARHLVHLGDHLLRRVDAERVVRHRNLVGRQAPQLIHRRAAQLAPQIVNRLVERDSANIA